MTAESAPLPSRVPGSRGFAGWLVALGAGAVWILGARNRDFPNLHIILDTAAALLSAVLAVLFWDVGKRLARPFPMFVATSLGVTSIPELVHVLVTVEWTGPLAPIARGAASLRPGTWPLAAYILPVGLGVSLATFATWGREATRTRWLALGLVALTAALFPTFRALPRYTAPTAFGVTRPSLALVPLAWATIGFWGWRWRERDRTLGPLTVTAAVLSLGAVAMLYSRAPHDQAAMVAHLAKVIGYLSLLLTLMRMASLDMFERIRAERALAQANENLELKVARRTRELAGTNRALEAEIIVRLDAEEKVQAQLKRLNLLHQITRAIAERQDLRSIFQVVVRDLEDELPVDFSALCVYDRQSQALIATCVGAKSSDLASELAMAEHSRVPIDENGLARCVGGELVYEPDASAVPFPFPTRLARAGLRSLVMSPLVSESRVFGVLVAARRQPEGFSSGECEFLRQLSEHVALATHQAQLYSALQQAYDDLRRTHQAVMRQERLRVLGQMASGIAHDINNAISPVALYTESLLEREPNLSQRAREQLRTIQRAVEDVANTVARMREFYRQREPELRLLALPVNALVGQVVELTRARWSDMPLQRGVVIELRQELASEDPLVWGVESELRDALTNLVFNAVDAMPDGGTLTICTRLARQAKESPNVLVEVTDTGVGMDEQTLQRCLEPFFTTKGERGTGLGLAMVFGTVQRHGAEVEIKSAPAAGTTVRLDFPMARPSAPERQAVPGARAAPKRLRVLVVDDDPLLLNSLRDTLEADGHLVVTANGGQGGIDAFRGAQPPDPEFAVVITDLGMPYVDGRKVARAIKETSTATPVILLTGWGQRLVADGDVPPHVDRVLSKPPKLRELREALAELCSTPTAQKGGAGS